MIRSCTRWAALVAVLASLTSFAQAETRTHIVKQSIDTLRVSMRPGRQLLLSFKSHVIDVDFKDAGKIEADLRRRMNTVALFAPRRTPLEQMSGRVAVATARYTLFIEVIPAALPEDADVAVEIDDADLVELCQARDQREVQETIDRALAAQEAQFRAMTAKRDDEHAREMAKRDVQRDKQRDRYLLGQVSARMHEVALEPVPCDGTGMVLCSVRLMFMGNTGLVRLTAINRSGYDAPVTLARVYTDSTGEDLTTSTHIAVTEGGQGPQGQDGSAPSRGALGVIPRGATAIVSIKLRNPDRIGTSFRIVLNGSVSVLPAMQAVHLMDRVQLEAEERQRQRKISREAQRVSLHVTGSYGAIWFPAGVLGVEETEAASLKGVGVRVTKGLFPLLALEGDIAGATSGTATFREVGGMGDLTRSAKLARASFGGVLRLGGIEATVIPTLRLGVGLQLVEQDATLMTGSGPIEGPGTGLEVGGSVYGGAGVDVKLGSNLIAGVGLAFTQSDQRILDLGINLAYRWDAVE